MHDTVFSCGYSRRGFIAAGGAALVAASAAPQATAADAKELVLANWGGAFATNTAAVFGNPFKADTGTTVRIDGSGPTLGRIKAMVDSKQVVWDICDSDLFTAVSLGRAGLLEPVDYSIVDQAKIGPGWFNEFGAGSFIISWVLAYSKQHFPNEAPATPNDFFDLKKFPGKRAVFGGVQSTMEWALRADGVPADKLYPLDVPRGVAKLKTLGPDLVSYVANSDVVRRLRQGEVAMAIVGHIWASVLENDTKGMVTFGFDHALLSPQCFLIPKGNPAGVKLASQFIASTQDPQRQLNLFMAQASGPTNPAATALIPPDRMRLNPTAPANIAVQIKRDEAWYADNYIEANAKFRELMAS